MIMLQFWCSGVLGVVEYTFITITPRSTQNQIVVSVRAWFICETDLFEIVFKMMVNNIYTLAHKR